MTSRPGIRTELIDQALDADPRDRQAMFAILDTMSWEEIAHALEQAAQVAAAHREAMVTLVTDPAAAARADELTLLTSDPGDDQAGQDLVDAKLKDLPANACHVLAYQMAAATDPAYGVAAAMLAASWTPAQRRLLEERFPRHCPHGWRWEIP